MTTPLSQRPHQALARPPRTRRIIRAAMRSLHRAPPRLCPHPERKTRIIQIPLPRSAPAITRAFGPSRVFGARMPLAAHAPRKHWTIQTCATPPRSALAPPCAAHLVRCPQCPRCPRCWRVAFLDPFHGHQMNDLRPLRPLPSAARHPQPLLMGCGPRSLAGHATGPSTTAGHAIGPSTTGRATSPSTAGHATGPSIAGHATGPSTAGHATSLSIAGRATSHSTTGRATNLSTTGRAANLSSADRATSPSSAGHTTSPSSAGHTTSPSIAGRSARLITAGALRRMRDQNPIGATK